MIYEKPGSVPRVTDPREYRQATKAPSDTRKAVQSRQNDGCVIADEHHVYEPAKIYKEVRLASDSYRGR